MLYMAKPIMRIAFFCFPLADLADITSCSSHFFSTYSEYALNPSPPLRTHVDMHPSHVLVQYVNHCSPLPPAVNFSIRPRQTTDDRTKNIDEYVNRS